MRLVDAGMPVPDPAGAGAELIAELSRDDLGARRRRDRRRAVASPYGPLEAYPCKDLAAIPPAGDSLSPPASAITRETPPRPPEPRTPGLSHPHPPAVGRHLTPTPMLLEGGPAMIKWNYPALRVVLALGAIASFVVASGAGMRWH